MKQNSTDTFINKWSRKKYLLAGSLFLIFLYLSPYFILGERFPVTVHDNLDANVAWIKMLLESGGMFYSNHSPIHQAMNGLPRVSLYGSYDISLLVFWIFGMYWGYTIHKVIIALVGFYGMLLLLKKYFIPENKHELIQFGVAVSFALLPFWSFGFSVAGLPLLLYAFLNIRAKENLYGNWLIIGLFPFCSSLVTAGIFFMTVIVLITLYDALKTKKINYYLLTGLVVLGIMYVISHHRLFYSFLIDSEYVSHRYEFLSVTTGFPTSFKNSIKLFLFGQYHAHSRHTFILIPVAIGLFLMWKTKETNKKFIFLLLFISITSIFYGFLSWDAVSPIKKAIMSFIPIQLQRFHFLHPMFWHILFGISLARITNKSRAGKYFVIFCLIIQFVYMFKCHELVLNRKDPSFREFYAEEQFEEIKFFIGASPDTYRVVSLGLHPSIAQYNGFYTLDGYFSDYPLSYKHLFRKIIAGELQKDLETKKYFDNWGSRCYAFSAELGRDFTRSKNNARNIERLDFNINAFKEMGGKFIISSAKINNVKNRRYNLLKIFTDSKFFWTIYLYKVS